MEVAASIIPGCTSFNEASTILATIGIAPIVKGTMAAVVPIDLPTTKRVNGISSTSRIRNGSDLVILTIVPTTALTTLFSSSLPLEVEYSTTPRGNPTAYENSDAKNVIISVSHTPVKIASFI